MRRWRWLVLSSLTILATACGLLPGTSDGDPGALPADVTAGPRPTSTPTPTPTARPTATPRPTSTPLPTPSPTPSVTDSYTDLLASMRDLFTTTDLEAGIGALVPLPFPLPIPAGAQLERVEFAYDRADVWEQTTGQFPAVDTPARVDLSVAFLTDQDIASLTDLFATEPLAAGFVVETDESEPGQFSDVLYELNGGVLQRGTDGEVRVIIFRQGDQNFVEVQLAVELNQDPGPAITEWPLSVFTIPFSGDYTNLGAQAIKGANGVEVLSRALWTLGTRGTSESDALNTLVDEYPSNGISVVDTIQAGTTALATINHPTGSSGSISVSFVDTFTQIDLELLSLPG